MSKNNKNRKSFLEKLVKAWEWLARVSEWLIIFAVVGQLWYQAFQAPVITEKVLFFVVGLISGGGIYLTSRVMDWFFKFTEKSSDWLAEWLLHFPSLRRWLMIGFLIVYLLAMPIGIFVALDIHLLLKIGLFYLLWIIPSSVFAAAIRVEKMWDMPILEAANITPNLIAENPQAAIENAFTHFEHRLRERLGAGADLFGESLINRAFGKDGLLCHGATEGENNAVRNFVAGAYGTFRNPRKHRIIQDDVRTTYRILMLVELLLQIVDEAEDRPINQKG